MNTVWEEQNGIVNFLPQIRQKWLCTVFVQKVERTLTLRYLQPEKTIDQVAEYPSVIGFWQRKISTSGWKDHPEEGKELDLPWGVRVCSCGGRQYQMGSRIIVEKARKVLIRFTGRTTFRSAEPKQWCREHLASLSLDTYAERKREHIQDYQTYFNASRLTFRQEMNLDNLTTPERLKKNPGRTS